MTDVPMFVSRTPLVRDYGRTMPRALGPWALDSGGFTELDRNHGWTISAREYATFVRRAVREIGPPEFVAPQDWMTEPRMLRSTGLTVAEHQRRTVDNFRELRELLGEVVIPVVQGWTLDDYLACVELYEAAGVDLGAERLVGLGTVCRRQHVKPTERIVRRLAREGLRLHGFGVKLTGLELYGDVLMSADSMAWSLDARWNANHGIPSCEPAVRRSCSNCLHYALEWRERVTSTLGGLLCVA